MKSFIEKFKINELRIIDFVYWTVSLRPEQPTLCSLVISLKRQCKHLSQLSKEESSELQKVFTQTESMLKSAISYEKINYLALMMVDDQVHFHVVPRYSNARSIGNHTIIDEDWPSQPSLRSKPLSLNDLVVIKNILRNHCKSIKKFKLGYTTGVYDLFHVGHLNLLRNAKKQCDRLVVGVTTDELCLERKNKLPVIPFSERIEIVKSIKYVDQIVEQKKMDKIEAWNNIKFDVMFVGDDWKGTESWNSLEVEFNKLGAHIEYLQYTLTTSSTILKEKLNNL